MELLEAIGEDLQSRIDTLIDINDSYSKILHYLDLASHEDEDQDQEIEEKSGKKVVEENEDNAEEVVKLSDGIESILLKAREARRAAKDIKEKRNKLEKDKRVVRAPSVERKNRPTHSNVTRSRSNTPRRLQNSVSGSDSVAVPLSAAPRPKAISIITQIEQQIDYIENSGNLNALHYFLPNKQLLQARYNFISKLYGYPVLATSHLYHLFVSHTHNIRQRNITMNHNELHNINLINHISNNINYIKRGFRLCRMYYTKTVMNRLQQNYNNDTSNYNLNNFAKNDIDDILILWYKLNIYIAAYEIFIDRIHTTNTSSKSTITVNTDGNVNSNVSIDSQNTEKSNINDSSIRTPRRAISTPKNNVDTINDAKTPTGRILSPPSPFNSPAANITSEKSNVTNKVLQQQLLHLIENHVFRRPLFTPIPNNLMPHGRYNTAEIADRQWVENALHEIDRSYSHFKEGVEYSVEVILSQTMLRNVLHELKELCKSEIIRQNENNVLSDINSSSMSSGRKIPPDNNIVKWKSALKGFQDTDSCLSFAAEKPSNIMFFTKR
jgi:hypothetical protein